MAIVLWLTRLIFVSFNILFGVLLVAMNTDSCASVFETQDARALTALKQKEEGYYAIMQDHVLVGHVVAKAVVVDEFECQLKCIENKTCKSFNVQPRTDNAKRVCELNNKTRQMKPDDFKRKKGSNYYGSLEVSCIDVSHEQNGRSMNSGHCQPGYKGKRCETRTRGLYSHLPGQACKDILGSGDTKGNGKYWIDPEKSGNPLKVYCDMTTDGGGWLLVSNIVVQESTLSSRVQLPAKTSYRGISSDQMVLKKDAMKELFTHYPFTQLRFHCSKKKEQRTFHVITAANSSGEVVVRYFSGQTDVMPNSCGSFVRMEDDNSKLARNCTEWGHQSGSYGIGKWGHGEDQKRLYEFPALVGYAYHWMLDPLDPHGLRYECDDTMASGVSIGDSWKVYVR